MFVSKKRKFYFGFQVTLVSDRQGLKLFSYFRLSKLHWEHEWLLKEDPEWNKDYSYLTPTAGKPEELTSIPDGIIYDPEDI